MNYSGIAPAKCTERDDSMHRILDFPLPVMLRYPGLNQLWRTTMTEINLPDYLPSWIKDHIELYLKDGEAGHLWDASLGGGEGRLTTLLLTTRGRKSGKRLTIPLIYRPTGDGGLCVIASKGGAPSHPAWYLNLSANPEVQLKVVNHEYKALARVTEGEERTRLWNRMVEYYAPYIDYQAATKREIPVVVFTPA